jgi:hypothetical protein
MSNVIPLRRSSTDGDGGPGTMVCRPHEPRPVPHSVAPYEQTKAGHTGAACASASEGDGPNLAPATNSEPYWVEGARRAYARRYHEEHGDNWQPLSSATGRVLRKIEINYGE